MRKFFILITLLCTLSSCKKDYVCKCTDWGTSNPPTVTYRTIHDTKQNAEAKCEDAPVIPEMGCVLQ